MKKRITGDLRNRVLSFMSAAIISVSTMPVVPYSTADAVQSANVKDTVNFPEVLEGSDDESAKLNHDDTLVDNGDGTFTFTSKITADYSFSDISESRLKSTDGVYPLDKAGTYLIELWGGDGGEGGEMFPLSFLGGKGGNGGFVYGTFTVAPGEEGTKKLVYEIGSKGESETRSITGGGTDGIGGGAGDIAIFSVGAGGGYSAVYLVGSDHGDTLTEIEKNDPSKVLMIAGGGGGGGAGASLHSLNFLSTVFGGEGKANGGEGGYKEIGLSGEPHIENFDADVHSDKADYIGVFFAGENGSTSGTRGAYAGQGATDQPGEIVKSFIGFLEGSSYPNDWQQTYQPDRERGVGGAGNFRGGGGGAGFAGGSGGLQNEPLDGRNVGGGGGGSSYIAKAGTNSAGFKGFTPFGELTTDQKKYFVDREDNDNKAVGGAVVIRYLPSSANYAYLDNVTVSGKVSDEFQILSSKLEKNKDGQITTVNDIHSGLNITATGSVAPVASGIRQGQEQDSLTITLKLKPANTFKGGNDVPIFAPNSFNCTSNVEHFTDKRCTYSYSSNTSDKTYRVSHVNVPFCYNIEANSFNVEKGTVYVDKGGTAPTNNIIKAYDTVANTYTDSLSDPYVTVAGGTAPKDDFSADYGAKGIYYYDAAIDVSAKTDGANSVGEANPMTPDTKTLRARSVVEVFDGELLDGFTVKAKKSLEYNNGTYEFKVDIDDITSQNNIEKSFNINQAIPSKRVLDLVLGETPDKDSDYVKGFTQGSSNNIYSATLEPGIYYVEVWGGDGGNGNNAPTSPLTQGVNGTDYAYGGYGGKGGYVNGFISLSAAKSISINLGAKGADSTDATVGGKGGKATSVNIGETQDKMTFIAGGGGGGTAYLRYYWISDNNRHMGYCGNDGRRKGGESAYRGKPTDSWYMTPSTSPYYRTDSYDGADGEGLNVVTGGARDQHRIDGFSVNNIEDYFAKGGNSVIGEGVSTELPATISNKLFINYGNNNNSLSDLATNTVKVNLGLYEYVYDFDSTIGFGFYISQWSKGSASNDDDDKFKRESTYIGTTKDDEVDTVATEGAVRITRLGVYGGYDYGSTPPDDLTDTTNTLDDVVDLIKDDYAVEYARPLTVTSNFSEYFDLAEDDAYTVDSTTGKDVGTHEYYFTSNNVEQTYHSSSTASAFSGCYTLTTDTYRYGLKGSDTVTFKLTPKPKLVGGNDIPLLDVLTVGNVKTYDLTHTPLYMDESTTEVSLSHEDSYPTDPQIIYLPRKDGTDWANVRLDTSVITRNSSPDKVIVDYNGTVGESDVSGKYSFASDTDKDYKFVPDHDIEVSAEKNYTKDGICSVVAKLEPEEAEKAVVISPVSRYAESDQIPVKVRYKVMKKLQDIVQSEAAMYISGDSAPASIDVSDSNEASLVSGNDGVDQFILEKIGDAYFLKLEAAEGYDLPDGKGINENIKVYYDDGVDSTADEEVPTADIAKKDGFITITIPTSAFTQNLRIEANGVEPAPHYVHYMYAAYDSNIKRTQTYETVQQDGSGNDKVYHNGDVITESYPFMPDYSTNPGDFPAGYDGYDWDWPIARDSNGKYVMGDTDIYVIGTYRPVTYKIRINYESDNAQDTAFDDAIGVTNKEYTSPDRTEYHNDTETFDIALTADTNFYRKSPEVTGYYTDTPFVSFTVDEEFIQKIENGENPLTSTGSGIISGGIDGHKAVQVPVTYKPLTGTETLIINFAECDISGNPTGASSCRTFTIDGAYDESTAEIAAAINSVLGSENEIYLRTKLVDGKETVFDEVKGNSSDGLTTFNVYYRPKQKRITVNFYSEADDPSPTATKTCIIGREYSYNADSQEYDSMPRALKKDYRLAGWRDQDNNIVREDDIVDGEENGTINLYAVWESIFIDITVNYKYAYNIDTAVTDPKTPGADIPDSEFDAAPVRSTTVKYGMSYTINVPTTLTESTLTESIYKADKTKISGTAFEATAHEVFYSNSSASEPAVTLKVNVYSIIYKDEAITGDIPKLTGGTFELYDMEGNLVGSARNNEDGSVTWNSITADIKAGREYRVMTKEPPLGFGEVEEPVPVTLTAGTNNVNVFLGKSPFDLPFAGGKPLTGYTVGGLSTMLLAAFLLFIYVSSKSEENEKE